jgi:hypothetical protein
MIDINSSYVEYFFTSLRKIYPNLLVIHHPYNGTPFSEYYNLSNGNKDVNINFGIGGFHIDAAYELVCEGLCSYKYFHLRKRMSSSIIKEMERGTRRYFPLKAKCSKLSKLAFKEAYSIIFNSEPEDDIAISNAILYNGLVDYIEEFDDKLWVRTIAL